MKDSEEKLRKKIQELENKIDRLEGQRETKPEKSQEENVSRRDFLKKMGAGAASLGALSLAPASANLKLTNTGIFQNGTEVSSGLNRALIEGKALADDGNAYSSVQTAVDNASSYVKIGPGTFNESVSVDKAGLTLEGIGNSSVINSNSGSSNSINVNSSNVTIKNLQVYTPQDASSGRGSSAIEIKSGSKNCNIKNIYIPESDGQGIYILETDAKLQNVRVDRASGACIRTNSARTLISDCIAKKASDSSYSYGKCFNIGGDDCVLSSSIARNSFDINIDVNGNDCVVVGNRSHNASDHGLRVQSGNADCIIANNRISGSSSSDLENNGTNTKLDGNLTGSAN